MTKLYEITQEYSDVLEVIAQVFEANPKLDEAAKQTIIAENLSSLQHDFQSKAFALAGYILNLKLEQSNVKELADRFTKRSRGLDKTITHLNNYLLTQMQQVNVPKLSNSWMTIQIKNNPSGVIIEDETLLSDEFKTTEVNIKINKLAIGEQIKAGVFVPYAHLESTQRLEIK
jgi:hypothetical protein